MIAVPFGQGEVSPMVAAILNEVIAGLHTLVATGQPTTIDLRRLPLIPHDLQRLRSSLGKGEVATHVRTRRYRAPS